MRIFNNIIRVCQVQKRNKERKEYEEKKKKRKNVRGNQHIKGRGSQIFKSRSRSIVKRSWSETWRDYRSYKTLQFSNFQKKRICFVRVINFWRLCARSDFLVISLFFIAFFDLQLWDLIDHKIIYMWQKFHVIWICIEKDPNI